jgi:putative sterol carrier protein
MAVDIPTLFNDQLPGALSRNAEDARTINAKFQLNIRDAGEWFIDTTETGPSVVSGNPGGASCTLNMSAEDFQKLHENPQAAGMQLYFAGKLKIEGNVMLAMKLAKLFSYT